MAKGTQTKSFLVGATISTFLFVGIVMLAFLISSIAYKMGVPLGWKYLNRGETWFGMLALAGAIVAGHFIIKKNGLAVLGSTLGYAIVLLLLTWIIEIGTGPAGF